MVITNDEQSHVSGEAEQDPSGASLAAAADGSPTGTADPSARPDELPGPTSPVPGTPPKSPEAKPRSHRWRKRLLVAGGVAGLAVGGYFLVPWIDTVLNTLSTEDAYVNGDMTFVAPRVSGQVTTVLVSDNNRVKKGDVLVQLDPEPFDIQVNIAKAAVGAARADLEAIRAQTRALVGQVSSVYFALQHAIEDVDTQIALLHARVATLNARQATLENAQHQFDRVERLFKSNAAADQEMHDRTADLKVAKAQVDEALEAVYQVRVTLGLPRRPESGDLTQVPANLDQTFSMVRQAQASLVQAAAQLGVTQPLDDSPKEMVARFRQRDPEGNIERIFAKLSEEAPAVKQAESKLAQAQRRLDEAELNRRYCDIVSEIDGVVTRKNVNPGNHVQVGESLMAVRSLTEIWIDANFKETQLADLRIGQRVRCEVDMYGSRREFEGRITGFTMGTGQTLALLPPQNATGNFVKIVQRLPVRIELTHYDPGKATLFVGLSVTPYVYYKEAPTGPHAGEVLQPLAHLPTASQTSQPTTRVSSFSATVNKP
jgi:membrane fusion protein (multidrug efflux system)